MPQLQNRRSPCVLLALLTLVGQAVVTAAQTSAESSAETRFQLDLHVSDAALKAMLPPGFISNVATQGPAKDANLRVIFIDRITVRGPAGKAVGTGSSQLVYLVAPVKDAAGADAQLVVGGMTGDPATVPGDFGVYLTATTHTMQRAAISGTGPVLEVQDWAFKAATGEQLEMHIKFERGIGYRLGPFDVKYYSAHNPAYYQLSKQEQDLDILRNTTTNPPDRVKEFSFKASGGNYAKLFDGPQKPLSWDAIYWFNQTITAP